MSPTVAAFFKIFGIFANISENKFVYRPCFEISVMLGCKRFYVKSVNSSIEPFELQNSFG